MPFYILEEEHTIYNNITSEARTRLDVSGGPAPAMSVVDTSCLSDCGANNATPQHNDNIQSKGLRSNDFWALVHTPVKPADIRRIPAAKDDVDEEFTKLFDKTSWDFSTVREKSDVKNEALKNKTTVHFGSIMELCHVKHSQLEAKYHRYKGRTVFRGDNIQD